MSAPKKIYLSNLVMAGAAILDKPVSDDDVEYIRADVIRNEIERLKTVQLKRIQEGDLVDAEPYDKNEAYNELLSFLDTIEPEKPMNQDEVVINGHKVAYDKDKDYVTIVKSEESVPNDLEEAADKYEQEYSDDETLGMAFIAGAKWQKEQDEKEQADLFTIVALDAAQRAKEQMMKAAVEGEVVKDWDNNLSVKSATISGFKFGDKVRVIVLPKEY